MLNTVVGFRFSIKMIMLRHVQAKYFAVAVLFSMLPLKEPVHNALCPTVDHSFPVLSVSSAAITLHGDCEDNGIYLDSSDHSPTLVHLDIAQRSTYDLEGVEAAS
jgi:hypothetical protein